MSVKLSIEISGPLDTEDRDLLSGVAIMTLAIANHEMAKNRFPEMFDADEEDEKPPAPCAFLNPDDPDFICVGTAGHRGRHKFRRIEPVQESPAVEPNGLN